MIRNTDGECSRRIHGRGPGSYGLIDADCVFAKLARPEGSVFLDLGCGPGDYSIHAARVVGPRGKVLAVDRSREMVAQLTEKALENGLPNIQTLTWDITTPLPFGAESVDTCFLSTVLHSIRGDGQRRALLIEAHRVLVSTGILAVLEIKRKPMPFGPPLQQRIAEKELSSLAQQCGFRASESLNLDCFYLAVFRKK